MTIRDPNNVPPPTTERREEVRPAEHVRPAGEAVETMVEAPRETVRWGPIWGGLLVSVTLLVLLGLVGVGLGVAGQLWWGLLIGIVAFLVGGYVSGRFGAFGPRTGTLHGILVWATALVFTLVLVALGAVGVASLFGIDLTTITGPGGPGAPPVRAEDIRTAAWGTFLALLLGLASAAIGGWLGGRQRAIEEPEGVHRHVA